MLVPVATVQASAAEDQPRAVQAALQQLQVAQEEQGWMYAAVLSHTSWKESRTEVQRGKAEPAKAVQEVDRSTRSEAVEASSVVELLQVGLMAEAAQRQQGGQQPQVASRQQGVVGLS